ncbi:MAG TPA: radical SAM protein [Candidatus Eremiobacteraceae bacterium]|nr:radical SAM protein [Candidatus Eremiobacteraceae bacterium]
MNALFARADGSVLDLPRLRASADDGVVGRAERRDFIPLPEGSLLLTLPGRSVIGFEGSTRSVVAEVEGSEISAVAAALPLGYTRTLLPAYVERAGAPALPLYGYAAVAWEGGRICVGAARTDELETWSPSAHAPAAVRAGIEARMREFPKSALIRQLALCATEYGCFTAQNVFLRAGEAAIPVSPACNAKCIGCISEQEPDAGVQSAQARVRLTPTVDEIVSVALAHVEAAPDGIVSFGQGCEGEPLLAAPLIARAIEKVRATTSAGTLHINTNASRPRALEQLLAAGVTSVRVSLNSARPEAYAAYYRPQGYSLADVLESVRVAGERKASISLNLLTHPGVTDDPDEMSAFAEMLKAYPISMVQTRTLNVDPAVYFSAVGRPKKKPVGMRSWLAWLAREFPNVRIGNFTRGFG